MCFKITSCAAIVFVLCSTPSREQQPPNEMQELRRTMEKLDEHLRQLEQSQGKSNANERVTQIGSMRNGRDPETIVRIYDLSDLFAMAPSYQAMQLNDLGGASVPLVPHRDKATVGWRRHDGWHGRRDVQRSLVRPDASNHSARRRPVRRPLDGGAERANVDDRVDRRHYANDRARPLGG